MHSSRGILPSGAQRCQQGIPQKSCSGTKAITAVGAVKDVDGKKVLVATKINLAGDEAKSDAPNNSPEQVSAPMRLQNPAQCQGNVIVDVGGKKILHFIEHNDVSQAYHSEVCQGPKATVVHGKVTEVNGSKRLATKIEVAPKKEAKVERGSSCKNGCRLSRH